MSKLTETSELDGRRKTLYLKEIKDKFQKNKEVKLRVKNESKRMPVRIVKGTVIQINDFFVVIKGERTESFKYSEFLEGRAKIIS